ncbi:unnamed protein product [Symbiodinium natans]|uniref:Uncharacterized protein n=1 Tax=Symbiodinium natans TaxID=878477 RepID=A0A812QXL2_9DINO|nr:unnamed protein product [Symbiodinium natans]
MGSSVVVVLPLFQIWQYPEIDDSMGTWAELLNRDAIQYREAYMANNATERLKISDPARGASDLGDSVVPGRSGLTSCAVSSLTESAQFCGRKQGVNKRPIGCRAWRALNGNRCASNAPAGVLEPPEIMSLRRRQGAAISGNQKSRVLRHIREVPLRGTQPGKQGNQKTVL